MDLEDRIRRRIQHNEETTLVTDYSVLSPATHVADPVDRGSIVEQLLTHFDPAFEGEVPRPLYLHGPPGSGKSAIVTALFRKLSDLPSATRPIIHTTTRVDPSQPPAFLYTDSREVDSEFAFYRTVLDAVTADDIPKRGVGTAELRDRLRERSQSASPVIVAIDHLGGRESTFEDVIEWVEPFSETVGLVAIGRGPPEETPFETMAGDSYRFTPYQKNKLADILTQRASYGLVDDSLTYDAVEPIIEWANGNAHDAIAALFVAADRAERRNQDRIDQAAANAAVETLPEDPVSLDRLCVQPENRQAVLRELVELDPANRESVEMAAEAVTEQLSRELSQGTVKRFIYEAAEEGLLDRVEKSGHAGSGRPPSSIKPAFPVPVFRRLYDMEHGESPDESTESTEKAPS